VLAEPPAEFADAFARRGVEMPAVGAESVVERAQVLLRGALECDGPGDGRLLNAGPVGRDRGFEFAQTRLCGALERFVVLAEPTPEFADGFARNGFE